MPTSTENQHQTLPEGVQRIPITATDSMLPYIPEIISV